MMVMDASEIRSLIERLAQLEARLANSGVPELPPIVMHATHSYTPPITTPVASLMASGALRYASVREVRQLSVAVALARGDALPGGEVPVSYEQPMLALFRARAEGLSWRAALERCGLIPPDDVEIAHRARTLRSQLRGLWDGLEGLLGPLQTVCNPVAYSNFVEYLRRLLV